MAGRLSIRLAFATACVQLVSVASAATRNINLDISWMRANPDGQFEREVIGVNGQWPPPIIYADKGDQMVVNVVNNLKNQSTAVHFHGMFQNGTTHSDGAAGTTQCAIPPGSSFTYNFTLANQAGTFWYHSHVKGQYPEGLRAPFIIRDPESPIKDMYDEELVISLSDWYHTSMKYLIEQKFMTLANPSGAEPVPNSALMNDTQNTHVKIQPGKTYLVRLINMGAFAATRVWFEGHTMRVVEVDGVWTEPMEASMVYLTVAQRYSVLITAKNDTASNFPIVSSMDEDLFDVIPDGMNSNVTGWLVYDDAKPMPEAAPAAEWTDLDDFKLVPFDKKARFPAPDYTMTLDVMMDNLGDGKNYAFFSGSTYVVPKVPSIFTAMSVGEAAANATVYGANSNAYMLEKGQVVEIVVNNADPGKHPFHLHGHHFQVIDRGAEEAGNLPANATDEGTPSIPMRRDVISVWPNSYARLRFVADNPGVWLFHCHIEWHTISGLVATLIESPLELQKSLTIPESHYKACEAAGIPTKGNAAGNVQDPFNLDGANVSPDPLPAGFTAKGIVALVFSCIAAFLGCAVIAWYGWVPLKK